MNRMFSGGKGTEEEPYLVSSVNDLIKIAYYPESHFRQIQDIDLNGINWAPIFEFRGTYDGQNFKIKNLSVNSNQSYLGLFGTCFRATLKNIEIINANVQSTSMRDYYSGPEAGILAGVIVESEVTNCHIIKGTVHCPKGWRSNYSGDAGGLASTINLSKVSRCSVEQVDVQGHWGGGFASYMYRSDIDNCYVLGTVRGPLIGTFAYIIMTSSTIKNCYSAVNMILFDDIVNNPVAYAFANKQNATKFISCYTDITVAQIGWGSADIPEARTTSQMMTKSNYVGWDFENIWKINEGVDYPRLIKKYRTYSQTHCKAFIRKAGKLILTPVSD